MPADTASQSGDVAGRARVRVTPDKLTAKLLVDADLIGDPHAGALIQGAVAESGIELTEDVRDRMDLALFEAKPGENLEAVIAEATPAKPGSSGRVEWDVDSPEFQALQRSRLNSDIDDEPSDAEPPKSHYDRVHFIMVEPGDVLGRVLPPEPAEDGRDVFGEAIDAPEPIEHALTHDDSILRKADGTLIAQQGGVLHRNGDHACIDLKLEVSDYIDFSTGNIDFAGDITVKRGVRDRFTVRANNIEVHGLIEAATMIARDGLSALGGFAGRERGSARVGRVLEAKYLDNVEGDIGGGLEFEREIINCDLVVHGSIRSNNGAIVGGRIVVTGACRVAQVGSSGGAKTVLAIGCVPRFDPLARKLRPIVENLLAERRHLNDEKEQIDELITAARATPTDRERLTALSFEMSSLDRLIQRAQPSLEGLEKTIAECRVVDLMIERRLHGDAVIMFGDEQYRVLDAFKGPIRIALNDEGQLTLEDAIGPRGTFEDLCEAGHLDRRATPRDEIDLPPERVEPPMFDDAENAPTSSPMEAHACAS
ncbi:MAG: FapA family protein [Planctomycetota bacterium]